LPDLTAILSSIKDGFVSETDHEFETPVPCDFLISVCYKNTPTYLLKTLGGYAIK